VDLSPLIFRLSGQREEKIEGGDSNQLDRHRGKGEKKEKREERDNNTNLLLFPLYLIPTSYGGNKGKKTSRCRSRGSKRKRRKERACRASFPARRKGDTRSRTRRERGGKKREGERAPPLYPLIILTYYPAVIEREERKYRREMRRARVT